MKNNDYCKYCYENGHFKQPEIDLKEMKKAVKTHIEKGNFLLI
ncbi:zinc ribbon domain-containing protein [Flavobacterium sp. LB1P71]